MNGDQEKEEKAGWQKDVLTGDGPIAGRPAPILTDQRRHEIHQLACNLKGAYIRVLKLCKELDIPFSS